MEKIVMSVPALLMVLVTVAGTFAAEPPKDPILRIETGMHTVKIRRIATDASGRWLVTASDDKSLRVWELPPPQPSPTEGRVRIRLERTIRPPLGEGNEGKLFSVALSPDGSTIACGGWTKLGSDSGYTIYLFDRANGNLTARITGLSSVIAHLAFSPDGRFMAASLGENGVRLYRTSDWSLAGEDREYMAVSYSAHFSPDNRMVTTSYDGYLRLYDDMASGSLRLTAKSKKAPGGRKPYAARFSPDGSRVAVGYTDTTSISILSGRNLSQLFTADTGGVTDGSLAFVTWSADGRYLFAGGTHNKQFDGVMKAAIRRWPDGGRGSYSDSAAAGIDVMDLVPLPDGRIAFGSGDASFGLLDQAGQRSLFVPPDITDYRAIGENFLISGDGSMVGFSYESFGKSPANFNLTTRKLTQGSVAGNLKAPITAAAGLIIDGFNSSYKPMLNGTYLKIEQYTSRSLAIAQDGNSFVLGAEWALRRFDHLGSQLWEVPAPGTVWGVNIPANGTMALAAYADGTIRWHRLADGKELLAFFPHADRKRWVLWTPEGFFDHSPGGEELIGWHLNRGKDRAAEFIPVGKLYNQFYRPDLINAAFEGKDLSEYVKTIDINKLLTGDTLPPKVRLLTQAGKAAAHDSTIKAELCDNGGGIGDINLYLNGMPVAISKGGRGVKVVSTASTACSQFEHTITLADGDNDISLMAYNKAMTIESNRDSIKLSYASGSKAKPDLHILTVAVNSYRDGDLRLSYSVPDAQAIAASFQGLGGNLFGRIVVHQLLDAEVTKAGMEKAFVEIGKQTGRDDVFVLFVAGHGITGTKDGAYYFLPHDFRYTGEDAVARQGVSMDDFKGYLANVNALKSLILLDTCNSGSFSEAIASRGMVEKTAINKLVRAVGRATIVASSKSQVAMEGYEGHGAFTWTLLDGLNGKAADGSGRITINGLATHVEELLPQITFKKWGYEQIPQKSLQGMDFPIGVR